MPKSRQRKEGEVKVIEDKLIQSKSVVVTTQKGVTVKDIEQLRRDLRTAGSELVTVKKTLLERVAKEKGLTIDASHFDGTVGLAFSYDDEVAAARTVYAFGKKVEGFSIAAGIMDASVMTAAQMTALAQLPGKQELLGQVVRTMAAPVSGFVNVLAGNLRSMVTVLQAIHDRKQKA